jgi:hypothetical protein
MLPRQQMMMMIHRHHRHRHRSSSKPDQFCADIKATIRNNSTRNVKDVVIKGQLTLPPKGQLTEYVFGDLTNFGVKVDTRTLRVAWVQFKLAAKAVQEVVFPVCVRRREYIGGVQLSCISRTIRSTAISRRSR